MNLPVPEFCFSVVSIARAHRLFGVVSGSSACMLTIYGVLLRIHALGFPSDSINTMAPKYLHVKQPSLLILMLMV